MSGLLETVWKVAAPVASGAVGVAGTIWKVTKTLEDRVKHLETVRVPDTERRIADAEEAKKNFDERKYPQDLNALKTLIDALRGELNEEVERLYTDLRERSKERREERRLQAKLGERYLALESRIEACEQTINRLNDTFVQHAKGQQEQWQEISRALGHIEGWLRAMTSRRTSGEFRGPQGSDR